MRLGGDWWRPVIFTARLDGTVEEEKIIHAAGAHTGTSLTKEALIRLIAETGYTPVERDSLYHEIPNRQEVQL